MTSDKTSGEKRGEVDIASDENAGSVQADDSQENSNEVSASDDSPESNSDQAQEQPEVDAQQPDQSALRPTISIESQKDRIRQVINDTQLLISHASIAGKEVPKNHIEIIANAERNFELAEFDASKEAEFWSAVANITKDVSPITVESIFYTRAERRRLRERFDNNKNINHIWSWFRSLQNVLPYLTFTLITLAVLIFFQIKWVGGSNMVKAIENLSIAEENLKDKIARLYLVIETTDSEDEKFGELTVDLERRIDERDQKQSALSASRFLLEEWVSSYISDPQRPIEPGIFASDETVEKWRQEKVEWDLAREQKQESKNDLVFQQAQGVLQYMAGYFLPLLYGLLGSFTYVLRALSREISGISFSRGSHIQFMLRLLLGMLAGISVGWFLRPETEVGIVDISPFALAFLAGYSVELVFTAMDKIVNAFSGSGSANNPN